MVKYWLLFLCCCIQLTAHCQEKENKEKNRISWGLLYAPALTYRELHYSSGQQFIATMRNHAEKPRYGFTAGIVAQKQLGKKAVLELGGMLWGMGYKTKDIPLVWQPATGNQPLPSAARFSYNYLHVGFTARFRHLLFGDKIRYYLMPGIGIAGLVTRKTGTRVSYPGGAVNKSSSSVRGGFSETAIIPSLAFGGMYKISKKITLCLEPCFWYNLQSITPGKENREHLYAAGINTMLLYTRNKK